MTNYRLNKLRNLDKEERSVRSYVLNNLHKEKKKSNVVYLTVTAIVSIVMIGFMFNIIEQYRKSSETANVGKPAIEDGHSKEVNEKNVEVTYDGMPLNIAVVGDIPEIKNENIHFESISLEKLSDDTSNISRNFDAIMITPSVFEEASNDKYVEVYKRLEAPIIFFDSNKGHYPFVNEGATYETANFDVLDNGSHTTIYLYDVMMNKEDAWFINLKDNNELDQLYKEIFEKIDELTSEISEPVVKNSSEAISKINVLELKDAKVKDIFKRAVSSARKEPGIVNMAEPQHQFSIGDETYFLWISKEAGTIMNTKDTDTIYTLSNSSVKEVYEFINDEISTLLSELQNEIIASVTEQTGIKRESITIMLDGATIKGNIQVSCSVGFPKDAKIDEAMIQQIVIDTIKSVSGTLNVTLSEENITINIERY